MLFIREARVRDRAYDFGHRQRKTAVRGLAAFLPVRTPPIATYAMAPTLAQPTPPDRLHRTRRPPHHSCLRPEIQ